MARKARVKSSTGIYHVLVRAVCDISLFLDDEDTTVFIQSLQHVQDKGYCTIYAYALFPTHVHLLIQEGNTSLLTSHSSLESIGSIMKRQAGSYTYYYNGKYGRFGSIYMDRFQSEPIEDLSTFTSCLHFISSQPAPYKGSLSDSNPFTDNESLITNRALLIESGHQSLITNHQSLIVNSFIDFKPKSPRITDLALKSRLEVTYGFSTHEEFLSRRDTDQVRAVSFSKSIGGTVLQIARITGLTRKVVTRMTSRGELTRAK